MNIASVSRTVLFIACFAMAASHAQIRVSLNVSSRPNPYVSEWASKKETAILTVTTPQPLQVKLYVEVKREGTLQAKTKLEQMSVQNIPAGASTFFADQMIPFGAVQFVGGAERTAVKTGMLPAGDYEFCIDLINPQTNRSVLSEPVCRTFFLTSYQPPSLVEPENGASFLATGVKPTFRWTPVTPAPGGIIKYTVRIFEVLEGQSPSSAMKTNPMLLSREVTNLTQLVWPVDIQMPVKEATFGWNVRATDEKGNPYGEPDGTSETFTFKTATQQLKLAGGQTGTEKKSVQTPILTGEIVSKNGNNNQQPVDTTNYGGGNGNVLPSGCQPSNTIPPTVSTTPGSKVANDYVNDSIKVGFFDMKVLSATGSASALSGKGSIVIPWLRTPIAVEFSNIKVNANDEVFNGSVVTEIDQTPDPYQTQWAANIFGGLPWTTQRIKSLDTWLKSNFGKLANDLDLQTQVNNAINTPVKLPLGINDIKGYTIAIAEMKFESGGAQLVAVMSLPVLEHNADLGFKVSGLFFTPSGPSFKAGSFGLLEDVTFAPSNDTYSVTFKAPTDSLNGTFIDWDCDGFRQAQIDIDIALPRTWVVPSPDDNNKVKSNLKTWITDWDDWIINANLPKCTIVGTNGTDLEVTNMAYDHSDLRNPGGIKFPKGYQGDSTLTFQGFFLKQAKLILPEHLSSYDDPSKRVTIFVNNLIINKTGITCEIEAANVLNYPKANVASLGASIDSVKISVLNSSVKTAYMRGVVTLPIADSTKTNALDYKALFQNGNGFQFTLTPKGPITSSFFAKGKFTLAQSSYLKIELKQKSSFDCKLSGDFEWADVTVGPIKNVKIKTKFENMQMSYTEGGKLAFNIGTWSFASPQKSIAKFPVTVENVKFAAQTAQGSEVLRGAVSFEVVVNLVEKIGGRTKLEVIGAVEKPAGKFRPKYIDARVDSISLYVKTAAVVMDGYVKFYQDDPMYGNGFKGAIKATFTTAQMEISASARFGTTSYNSTSSYRYWYVDAKIILPPPGVVFLPGYAFYGFGVGAWQRMNVTSMPKPDAAQVANASSTSGSASSGATFTPDNNIGFGFKLIAVLGTSPDPKKFNADITLGGQFSTNGGLVSISIKGELWAMAKLTERSSAPVKGLIDINYDHPNRIFHMQAKVDINKDPISTPNGVNMVMHLEGKTGNWYVKIGEPTNRNIIKVLGVNTESYFMFGKNITAPSGFSQTIVNGLNSVGVFNLVPSATATNDAIAGNGFAAGVGVNYDTGDRDKHLFDRVYLRYRVGGGFEVNLSLLKYPDNAVCASGGSLTGLNKWYAQGSVAAYAIFYVKIHIEPKSAPCLFCCKKKHPNGCDFTLADVRLGAYLTGGFPKPTWLQGEAGGSFNLLEGLVKGSFHVNIDYGSKCTPASSPETTQAAQAQDAAAEQQDDLVKSLYPKNNTHGFAITDRARILYGFTPNVSFDVIESQGGSAGATVNRTFQAKYTVTFEKKDGNTSTPVQFKTTVNSLGEYLVLLKSLVQTNMAIKANTNISQTKDDNTPAPIDLGPNLDSSTTYKLTVVGTLYELKNGSWVIAKNKSNQNVTETVATQFRTVAELISVTKKTQNINTIKN